MTNESSYFFQSTEGTPKKVQYYSHFPHYFLRPYKGQQKYVNELEFLSKLNTKNCEMLLRPGIGLSESAQGVVENYQQLQDSNFFKDEVMQMLQSKLNIMDSLKNLNTDDKSTTPTTNDVYQVMNFAITEDDQLDAFLANAMAESASMYVLCTQLRCLRGLIGNPQLYATKLCNDEPSAVGFKQQQTPQALQNMFDKMCCATPTTTSGNNTRRSLAGQLQNPAASTTTSTSVTGLVNPTSLQPLPQTPSTSTATPPAINQEQTPSPSLLPTANNPMMAMLLSLQQQLNSMQRQREEQSTTIPVSQSEAQVEIESTTTKRRCEDSDEEALEKLTVPKRKKKKSKK